MLNQHHHEGLEINCERCGERWDNPVHYGPYAEDKHYLHRVWVPAGKKHRWDHVLTAFFVLTFAASTGTIYNLCISRWDRATYFLVIALELLRLWGKHEAARRE